MKLLTELNTHKIRKGELGQCHYKGGCTVAQLEIKGKWVVGLEILSWNTSKVCLPILLQYS